jgi:hypothetical protein
MDPSVETVINGTKFQHKKRDEYKEVSNCIQSSYSQPNNLLYPTTNIPNRSITSQRMILEAAFVDPAYSWPPAEGQGKNAIELQAADDTDSVATSESLRQRMQYKVPVKKQPSSWSFLSCCKNNNNNDTAVANQQARASVAAAKKEYDEWKRSRARAKAKKRRADNKYNLVPEGILVYRLDTVTRKLVLVSSRHHDNNDTTTNAILTDMTVAQASPSPDKSRRGILLQQEDGTTVTLVACEQRTATAWLEAMNLMNAKRATTSAAGSQRAANKDLTVRCACCIVRSFGTIRYICISIYCYSHT